MDEPTKQETRSPEPESPSPEAAINAEEEAAASGTASARVSPAASPFITEPGPIFDPEAAAPGPEPQPEAELHALPGVEPGWEEETVQQLLGVQGELMHSAIGVAEADWLHTQADLKSIGGPLTRILNRYPATAAAAAMGDPVALALGVGAYGVRSSRERAAVMRARAEEEEQPITGTPAPPDDPHAIEWQRG